MKFLMVCGGSAGHINPALAIADRIKELLPESKFLFVGSGRRMEKQLIPPAGYELKNITITGFTRSITPKGILSNVKMLKNLHVSARESRRILEEFNPDAAIGTGGYVCYPVLKAANKMGIPTAIHESNAVPGLTTKMISGKVDKIMVAFPGQEKHYKNPDRVVFTGTPVRRGFSSKSKERARADLGLSAKPLVVSFWGSLGAAGMNEIMSGVIKLNYTSKAFCQIHASGNEDGAYKKMLLSLRAAGLEDTGKDIEVREYINNMDTVMAAAELVICRAGASTLAELGLMGKPAILVPSPYVTNNHQEPNARAAEAAGAAKVILEGECTPQMLYDEIIKLISDKKTLNAMSEAAKQMNPRESAVKIMDTLLSIIN